jgi:hypothetical protein
MNWKRRPHSPTRWTARLAVVDFVTAIVWRETRHDYLYELVPTFLLAFLSVWLVSLVCPESD